MKKIMHDVADAMMTAGLLCLIASIALVIIERDITWSTAVLMMLGTFMAVYPVFKENDQ